MQCEILYYYSIILLNLLKPLYYYNFQYVRQQVFQFHGIHKKIMNYIFPRHCSRLQFLPNGKSVAYSDKSSDPK